LESTLVNTTKPLVLAIAATCYATTAHADIEEVFILGNVDEQFKLTGSGNVIYNDDLQVFNYTDITRILSNVPGLYIRDEEGFGLRPNISIRGTYSDRSGKITLMEDGVLIAPAPYTASSAYYFPTAGRMHSVEVLKGPSAITTGPYTIGGAVNMISTPIPDDKAGFLRQEIGSYGSLRSHLTFGDGSDDLAYLVEYHGGRSDGFASIDNSDGDTGFKVDDVLFKGRYRDTLFGVNAEYGLKLQASEETSEQTYVGLTEQDFAVSPQRRYGLSRQDKMTNEHRQGMLSMTLSDTDWQWVNHGYYNQFTRDWYKVDKIDGEGIDEVLICATTGACGGMTSAYGDYDQGWAQQVLDGRVAADVLLKHNNRAYVAKGLQSTLSWQWGNHNVQSGIRYHEDYEARLQPSDVWQQTDNSNFVLVQTGTASRNLKRSHATSFFINDEIQLGALKVVPGLRHERYSIAGVSATETLAGLAFGYQVDEAHYLFAGVHQGMSPSASSASDTEKANNVEMGWRYQAGASDIELVGFYSDYKNIIGVCTNSGGAGSQTCEAGDTENGGAATIKGIELQFAQQTFTKNGWQIPFNVTYTYTDASFDTSFVGASVWGAVNAGDRLPNLPRHQLAVLLGAEKGDWRADLSVRHRSTTCAAAACESYQNIDAFSTLDLALRHQYDAKTSFYGKIDNLLDEQNAIVSREPKAGARAQKPRTFTLGVTWAF
jgi:Fe(3+) dicitrate transport protein